MFRSSTDTVNSSNWIGFGSFTGIWVTSLRSSDRDFGDCGAFGPSAEIVNCASLPNCERALTIRRQIGDRNFSPSNEASLDAFGSKLCVTSALSPTVFPCAFSAFLAVKNPQSALICLRSKCRTNSRVVLEESSMTQRDSLAGRAKPCRDGAAFTLIELLIVAAIVGLLAGMLLPALNKAKNKAQGIRCLHNLRQLQFANLTYSEEHEDRLVPYVSWVSGGLDFDGANRDNTNINYLPDPRFARLAPYTQSPALYKCPADRSTVRIGGQVYPRVRSVAMNAALGDDGLPWELYRWWLGAPAVRRFLKQSDIVNPAPSQLWVFADELPDSINNRDMAVKCDRTGPDAIIIDYPASSDNGACGIAFHDGHAEIHKWQDPW